jgi:Flp pilus assembly protein TadG
MKSFRQFRRPVRGQAALEVLVALAVLLPVIFGGIEFSRAISVRQSLSDGVYLAARSISLSPTNLSNARSLVSRSLTTDIFGSSGIDNSSVNLGSVSWDTTACANAPVIGCTFTYTASVNFIPDVPLLTTSTIHIVSTHVGIVETIP